jgi:hypothetical protein
MVEINGLPKIKLSQDVGKVTMPGRKDVFRLYGADGLSKLQFSPSTHVIYFYLFRSLIN